ncbi:MAG TPA: bifunctional (p)ppGpp synthetase/guanosine-3',5'-bis(diphosphate) 3'-pyrophosphohydrolase [Castellaniella sp.]|uniref:RelA/SpoT family protein n=1 Tax=Castellaniella sp. TaxID=1955812 RepID=UPI002EDF15EF
MNPVSSAESVDPLGPEWFQEACRGLDDEGVPLLSQAVAWVRAPLQGAQASTGEPLAAHGALVVLILQELGSDAATRAAALLAVQPVPEGEVSRSDPVRQAFGPEVITLVQGVRALLRLGTVAGQVGSHSGADQKEMQRKMLLAMAADLRIVLMRLASRLQSLRWYAASHTPCPESFAQETMTLYAPLANRLGIWQLKWEIEDLCFRFLQPETYKAIARQLEEKRVEREAFIDAVVTRLSAALAEAHIDAEINGRPKHIYSIWNKMRIKHLEFQELFDLRALRVIVADERTCYAVLAMVHAMWTPVPDEFDDYIARPKPNGYRSLHTVVADAQGRIFEIQIRTRDMHQYAEFGMAAHWRYKEAGARGGQVAASGEYDQKIAWMRQLLAWKEDSGPAPAAAPAGAGRIYVMTPQARVLELPEGSTPVDFAYLLHTDLGHRCRGARVDGQMVPLSTRLKTGQTIEIIAAKSGGPSRDWLNPQLAYLASPRARSKVRAWFNAVELQQRIAQGQTLVEKELQRLGRTAVNQDHLAQQLGFARADDLYVAAAKEEFSLRQIEYAFRAPEVPVAPSELEPRVFGADADSVSHTGKSGVLVVGVDSLLTQLARCCRPAPPDAIEGFVTRGRGVSIHRRDCPSWHALSKRHPERCIAVAWGKTGDAVYPVDITIHAQDRPAVLRDVSEAFARLRLRVVRVTTYSRSSLAHMVFTIEVRDGSQIREALAAVNELPGVQATRH